MSGMPPYDLAVTGGTVVNAHGRESCDVLVSYGRVVALREPGGAIDAGARVIDATGCFVIPGGVDVHTHFDAVFQGANTADDFLSGGRCAAAGGTTTHIDMCFQEAGRSLAEAADRWHAKAEGRAVCDYSLHLVITDPRDDVIREIHDRVDEGYTSYKMFTTYEGLELADPAVYDVMRACADTGAMPFVHAENSALVQRRTAELLASGKTAPRWHPHARPVDAESEAVARVIALARAAESPVYIAHVTCRESLAHIARAQAQLAPVHGETCAHYLGITDSVFDEDGFGPARFLCSPPIRGEDDQRAIWDGLRTGVLSVVSSDHGPLHLADRMRLGGDDFSHIPNGAASAEHLRELVWTDGVATGALTPERFVDVTATAPARLFGLSTKGRIAIGMDADIVVWDPEKRVDVTSSSCQSELDYCTFEGRTFVGGAAATLRRGELLWNGEDSVGTPGSGRFIARAPSVESLAPTPAGATTP